MDAIPPEPNHSFPVETADLSYTLLPKVTWRGREPVGFKGGQAVTLYKGRGSKTSCSSYRSILLLATWTKSIHQVLRPSLRTVFEAAALPLKIGGRLGCGIALGSHALRSLMRVCTQRGQKCLILFADISAAFYSALLQLIAQCPASSEAPNLDRALEGLALPSEALGVIRDHLAQHTALMQAGASTWLECLAAKVGHSNWFVLVNDDYPVSTARGTRPGSSWADVMFAILIPRILRRRDEILLQLGAQGEVPSFPWDGEMWADILRSLSYAVAPRRPR